MERLLKYDLSVLGLIWRIMFWRKVHVLNRVGGKGVEQSYLENLNLSLVCDVTQQVAEGPAQRLRIVLSIRREKRGEAQSGLFQRRPWTRQRLRVAHLQELGGRQVEVGVHYLEAGAQVLGAHLCNTTMAQVNRHEDADREDSRGSILKLSTRTRNLNP